MFFTNIFPFKLDDEHKNLTIHDLQVALEKKPFHKCLSNQFYSTGFVAPIEDDDRIVLEIVPHVFVMCLKREQKIMPDAAIKELLDLKIKEIKANELREVNAKEKRELKDNLIVELLPRALSEHTKMFAYWDTVNGWFVVNTSSSTKAENFLSVLRRLFTGQIDAVDEVNSEQPLTRQPALKAIPFGKSIAGNVAKSLTGWVDIPDMNDEFEHFQVGDECVLKNDAGQKISYKKCDLSVSTIGKHISLDMDVVQLGMVWKEKIDFVLDEKLAIKRVSFVGFSCDDVRTTESRFISEMIITAGEVNLLLNDLANAFGGLVEHS